VILARAGRLVVLETTTDPKRVKTVLIVDDEPSSLAVLARILQPHFRVRAARGGNAALAALRVEKPDLVLLDVMMPDLDGFAVLEQMRVDPRTAEIPVVFVTALGADEEEERGLRLGAVDFLTKPVRPPIVLARVRTHLALKEARDRLHDQNHWLEVEVERRTRDNALTLELALSMLAGMVETRDVETGNHTLRTQIYVDAVAQRLRRNPRFASALTPQELGLMVKAAPLHDIGKLGIPDAILLKPGPLTSEEFEVMKTHSRIGADAIAHSIERVVEAHGPDLPSAETLAFLETARQMALWHHEKWNGRGYPDGLAGEAIPLCARLMAVADVFDAVTMKRVYKDAMPAERAVQLIRDGRGTHFDPEVVDAFDAIHEDLVKLVPPSPDAAA
jgi:putative two-component system response regulator